MSALKTFLVVILVVIAVFAAFKYPVRERGAPAIRALSRVIDVDPDGTRLASLSPDGKKIAVADKSLTVLSTDRWQSQRLPYDVESRVVALDWTDDSSHLVTCGDDGSVSLWDVTRRTLEWRRPSLSRAVAVCIVVRSKDLALCGKTNGEIGVWDLEAQTEIASWAAHGQAVAASTPPPGTLPAQRLSAVTSIAILRDGSVLSTGMDGHVRVWSIATNEAISDTDLGLPIWWAAVAPDESLLALSNDHRLHLFAMKSWREVAVIKRGKKLGPMVWFSPDSELLIGSEADGIETKVLNVWRIGVGEPRLLQQLRARDWAISGGAFLQHPSRFVVTDLGGAILEWDLNSSQ